MSGWELILIGATGFLTAVASGIIGGGGAFIMTPLMILLGISPASAVATGKFNGLSTSIGSLSGTRKMHGRVSKAKVIPIMILAFVIGLIAPYVIRSLDSEFYRTFMGVMIIAMIPVLILKKIGLKPSHPKLWQKYLGFCGLSLALFIQGVFSGGLGILVNIVLMGLLGMTALEANITKRWSGLILNVTVIVGVIGSGLIIWQLAIIGIFSTLSGSYAGGLLAVKRGNEFIMKIMIGFMLISGLALIFGR